MKRIMYFLAVLLSTGGTAFAQTYITHKPLYSYQDEAQPIREVLDDFVTDYTYDNPVMTVYDTMLHNKYDYNPYEIPVFGSDVISSRIRSIPSAVPLEYNQYVQRYIDMYTIEKRDLVQKMLGLSKTYFPLFEAELDKAGMPIEIKYLTIVESALNPHARSRVGATGLWQFMPVTGMEYGLRVDSYIDERKDPYKSTVAAIEYLKRAHALFGDWMLALASYNCGMGNVKKAINRAGGVYNFWAIREYLPVETRGYVPAYVAALYTFKYYQEHNLIPIPVDFSLNQDTLHIKNLDISLYDIAQTAGADIDMLRNLNPELKMDRVPYSSYEPYILRVPFKVSDYFSTYPSYIRDKYARKYYYNNGNYTVSESGAYVSSGSTTSSPGTVAPTGSYNSSTPNYSSMPSSTPSYDYGNRNVAPAKPAAAVKPTPKPAPKKDDDKSSHKEQYYKIKPGDSLWEVAKKYNVTVDQLRKWNGSKVSKLTSGETIRVK
ncbi:MAG: transglycosylase SLT domain-containing protein [Bacteroidia bacterium]